MLHSKAYAPKNKLASAQSIFRSKSIVDRICYDSYKINIEYIDKTQDRSMREVYGLDPAQAQ